MDTAMAGLVIGCPIPAVRRYHVADVRRARAGRGMLDNCADLGLRATFAATFDDRHNDLIVGVLGAHRVNAQQISSSSSTGATMAMTTELPGTSCQRVRSLLRQHHLSSCSSSTMTAPISLLGMVVPP